MSTETESVAQSQEEVQEAPSPVDQAEAQQESIQGEAQESATEQERQEDHVPLSALQKERRKRQEAEQRARAYEEIYSKQSQQSQSQEQEDDQYEAATKADLKKFEKQAIRAVEEKTWIRTNPEKVEEINENLTEFLKQRPHLASAIENAPNRYEEAWALMSALSPRQKMALKPPPAAKKPAPGSPAGVPKSAGMNQSVDVMNMSDQEFRAWRQSQRKRR